MISETPKETSKTKDFGSKSLTFDSNKKGPNPL
uniref:Uncharacterized protein n=1 Tax=Dulem virus 35 TaxID=3145753 RepID=A0AAU8AYV7_9CAUD